MKISLKKTYLQTLSLQEGDTITLLTKVDDNWYEGSVHGRTGYFPVSYVQVVVPLPWLASPSSVLAPCSGN
jgi:hypothetical protein